MAVIEKGATRLTNFAVCSPGLESVLAQELVDLGASRVEPLVGGCAWTSDPEGLVGIACRLRTADALRTRVGSYRTSNFDGLMDGARRVAWHAWLPRGAPVRVRATSRKSRLFHTEAVSERIVRVLREKLDARPADSDDAIDVHVRIDHDDVTLAVDAGGRAFHQRGWRAAIHDAPLREPIAAAILRIAAPSLRGVLVDPFCGSGTIPLEWAAIQAGSPVRSVATLTLARWPTLRKVVEAASAPASEVERGIASLAGEDESQALVAVGGDRSAHAIDAAKRNLDASGLLGVRLVRADFRETLRGAPDGATVVTNPPWGQRVGDARQLAGLHAAFGRALVASRVADAWVLTAHRSFVPETALPWELAAEFDNRGTRVRLFGWRRDGAPVVRGGSPPAVAIEGSP